ncbi:MAG: quinolinate synthase NadA, partial [Chloroflexi bacterium]|nr:quinolinate synthase NadA [Chloroflexota bacterium]
MEDYQVLAARIKELKKTLNAVIVAHNYQRPEVQDIADFIGDSLELSRKCTQISADIIVFCGVHFMAESAAILNPNRMVLLPELNAGCPMADMITVESLREWKAKDPHAAVVCYINSSAAVKAESDICCTSANALKVVESIPNDTILFIPDQYLGQYVALKTKKKMIFYPGYCPTHFRLKPEHIINARQKYPEAKVIVHPECNPDVTVMADVVLSTSQMLRYIKESDAKAFLIGTEEGIIHRMRLENPDKEFYLLTGVLVCPNMKKINLYSVVKSLELKQFVITVPEDIRVKA